MIMESKEQDLGREWSNGVCISGYGICIGERTRVVLALSLGFSLRVA